ncbi:polyprenol phosphomannose-dependent alpha 1,6 mannosyltransferase MptB [Micromonospora sp. NPDC002389]|uniref:polyprenol phosphomannose-dependent alpha 1,6 mannosyltransferase MptB n=1 Tax=Micromonospora sp. NPDC002389 TaxID=3154272 RepID=UPI00331E8AC7
MTETGVRPASTRDRRVRYVGLLGAVALTVSAYVGGALPDATARLWHPVPTVLLWLLGTTAMVGAWWTLRGGAPSTGWAVRTAALWTVPLLFSAPLGSRDLYSYACQGWVYADGGDPYATGVAEAGCPWLDAVAPVWRDTAAPYGPFFVLLAALAVVLGGSLAGTLALLRVLAVSGLLLAAACLPGLARAAGVPPARATWLVLACPLVGVHLVSGAHNDAVMLGLLLLGLLLLVRRPTSAAGVSPGVAGSSGIAGTSGIAALPGGAGPSTGGGTSGADRPSTARVPPGVAGASGGGLPVGVAGWPGGGLPVGVAGWPAVGALVAAGVLLGLAVSVKATAVVVLPFAALAAVRGRYTLAALLRDGGTLAAGVVGALLVSSLVSGLGLGWIGGLGSSGDTVQWTSPPTAVGMVVDYLGGAVGLPAVGVPVARIVALALLAVLLVLLWWRTWSTLRGSGFTIAMSARDSGRLGITAAAPRPPGAAAPGAGLPDVGPPGVGLPGVGLPGVGLPGMGLPGMGLPGMGLPGVGLPSAEVAGGEAAGVDAAGAELAGAGEARFRVVLFGAGLALVLTVVLAPVFHPWYATWPLALLAVAAIRTTWFVVPVAAASFLALPDGTNLARLVKAPGAVAMTLLVVVLAVRFLPRLRRVRELR